MVAQDEQEPVINTQAPIQWSTLASLLQYRLKNARQRNDQVGREIAETEAIRGEIRCLKSLLDLPNEATRKTDAPPVTPF